MKPADRLKSLTQARRARLAAHEEQQRYEEMTAACDRGLVVDELDGVVGSDAWERATAAAADSQWSVL